MYLPAYKRYNGWDGEWDICPAFDPVFDLDAWERQMEMEDDGYEFEDSGDDNTLHISEVARQMEVTRDALQMDLLNLCGHGDPLEPSARPLLHKAFEHSLYLRYGYVEYSCVTPQLPALSAEAWEDTT
ncbi:MAG: hypothetical protein ACREHG_02240, partial [Candidatus Saccharimonadales bacterium]